MRSMDDIPHEIFKENIFPRLPAASVLDCRRVCKSWRNLLQFHHDTHFAHLHLRYQSRLYHGLITNQQHQPLDTNNSDIGRRDGTMSFVIFERQRTYYAEYHEGQKQQYFQPTRMNLKFPVDFRKFLVSSCNGLICLLPATEFNSVAYFARNKWVDPLYICNPITREIVAIPGLSIDDEKQHKNGIRLVHGFGYHPSTNEYKVVRICYHFRYDSLSTSKGHVEVYTLGSGKGWRNIGHTDYYIVPDLCDRTLNNCVNGSLHWFMHKIEKIVAFDLADEEFHLISKPPRLSSGGHILRTRSSRIFAMNGCLCVAYEYKYGIDLWILLKENDDKEENAAGTQLDHDAKEQYYKSWSWSKQFHIETTKDLLDPIAGLTKGGELVLAHSTTGWSMGVSMTRYNPKTKTKESLWKHSCTGKMFFYDPRIISHANSFISLRAMGEVNVETCIGSTDHDDADFPIY